MSGPLQGLRVVVTRPADKSEKLARLLRDQGAEVLLFPTIAIADPESWDDLDAALQRVERGDYEWTVFTSVNAVEKVIARARTKPALARTKVAAVGDATSLVLREGGVDVDLVPHEYTGEALAQSMGPGRGRVLLPRVEGAPHATAAALEERGWDVDEVVAYRNIPPEDTPVLPDFDVVTFASGSAARNFASLVDLEEAGLKPGSSKLVACIGPSTAEAARSIGLEVDVVADMHTDEGMVAALVEELSHEAPG